MNKLLENNGHFGLFVAEITLQPDHLLLEYRDYQYSLKEVLAKLTTRQKIAFAESLIFGLIHLHNLGISHGYIIPENILICQNVAKLANFCYAGRQKSGVISDKSVIYEAPEILAGHVRTMASDWWNLGVIICQMFADISFLTNKSLTDKQKSIVLEKVKSDVANKLPDKLSRIFRASLIVEPERRMTVDYQPYYPSGKATLFFTTDIRVTWLATLMQFRLSELCLLTEESKQFCRALAEILAGIRNPDLAIFTNELLPYLLPHMFYPITGEGEVTVILGNLVK